MCNGNAKRPRDLYALRRICIRENWFACGSNEQYSKMFDAYENGRDVNVIAAIIWACSENESVCGLDEIREKLENEIAF